MFCLLCHKVWTKVGKVTKLTNVNAACVQYHIWIIHRNVSYKCYPVGDNREHVCLYTVPVSCIHWRPCVWIFGAPCTTGYDKALPESASQRVPIGRRTQSPHPRRRKRTDPHPPPSHPLRRSPNPGGQLIYLRSSLPHLTKLILHTFF